MAFKLILSGNASHLRGLLYSSVLKPLAGVLRVKFLVLLIMLFIYIWTHIYVYMLHMCTHMHAPQPLLSPNDAQSPAAEKVNWKECLERSGTPYCRWRGRSVLGGQERSVTAHKACSKYKMFLFLFCYWEGNKIGKERGSVWRKDISYKLIVIATCWVSR